MLPPLSDEDEKSKKKCTVTRNLKLIIGKFLMSIGGKNVVKSVWRSNTQSNNIEPFAVYYHNILHCNKCVQLLPFVAVFLRAFLSSLQERLWLRMVVLGSRWDDLLSRILRNISRLVSALWHTTEFVRQASSPERVASSIGMNSIS